ncbi:MAG: glycosyltransferase [Alloprevotella sp.]|nr:glycosyltransferase [Alloprevotella sp.]MBR1652436.1 glycosyltransferase [Alloprevotella sp.]
MTDILLATYNAGRHLPALLHSLQDQTCREWTLIVHDDGSSDGTVQMLRDFAAVEPRCRLVEDGLRFGSAQGNFMHLLRHSTAPFAIFCDDDDIWLENKLEVLLDNIRQRDNTRPQAVWCNSYVYNPETAQIGGSATLAILSGLRDTLFANCGVQGCAILFNAALRDVCLPAPEVVAMHDHLLTLAAMTFGEMTYVPRHLMLYRRYEGTVTGHTDSRLSEKARKFFQRGKTVLDPLHLRAARSFYELHAEEMPEDKRRVFRQFFAYEGRSRISNACHALAEGFSLFGRRSILVAKLLLRPLTGDK